MFVLDMCVKNFNKFKKAGERKLTGLGERRYVSLSMYERTSCLVVLMLLGPCSSGLKKNEQEEEPQKRSCLCFTFS